MKAKQLKAKLKPSKKAKVKPKLDCEDDDFLNGHAESEDDDFLVDGAESEDDVENGDASCGSSGDMSDDEIPGTGDESSDLEAGDEFQMHKKQLANLENTDPEFYQYLKENDKKLLDFQASDSEDSEAEAVHQPPDTLEVDSEDSDFEDPHGKKPDEQVVNLAKVQNWTKDLIEKCDLKSIVNAVEGFQAALDRVTGNKRSILRVDSSAVFNAIIEMCVMHLQPAIVKFLKLPTATLKNIDKTKRWVKLKNVVQLYVTDLLKLLEGVSSEHIISVILKHLHSLCAAVIPFNKLSRQALKQLSKVWSSGGQVPRVLAFLCILKLLTLQKSDLLTSALKIMYISFIRSSKFVSGNTLAQITFMRSSLCNLFTLDPSLSYQHAFMYIRQLAIHLRNAVTLHKKESFQTVYNWQYVQSLRLWVDLICSVPDSTEIQQLLYPLTQIIVGCIKLIPTAQYLPLRFHCIRMLIQLNTMTHTYIPALPLILGSFKCIDLDKKHTKMSMKPFDFTFILRLSKLAMTESAYTDAVVENIYILLLEELSADSHSIAFPDLTTPTIMQLKNVIKTCKTMKYKTKFKQLLSKIEENAKFVTMERKKLDLNLSESDKVLVFETNLKVQGTPLSKFWEQYNKFSSAKKLKETTDNDKMGDFKLPKIEKKNLKRKTNQTSGPVTLFPSDDEDNEDIDDDKTSKILKLPETTKPKRAKKVKPVNIPKEEDDGDDADIEKEDFVQDLNIKSF